MNCHIQRGFDCCPILLLARVVSENARAWLGNGKGKRSAEIQKTGQAVSEVLALSQMLKFSSGRRI